MSPLELVLLRVLIADVLPGGFGVCRQCTEPLVFASAQVIDHYGRNHRTLVAATFALAVIGLTLTSLGVRSTRA